MAGPYKRTGRCSSLLRAINSLLRVDKFPALMRLGSSIDRRSVNCRYGEDDESRRTKRRENVAHPSNSSRPKVGR